MWEGYDGALAMYGYIACLVWRKRGYRDTMLDRFDRFSTRLPKWFGNQGFHRSHRANLVAKNPRLYTPLFGDLVWEPYVWPK